MYYIVVVYLVAAQLQLESCSRSRLVDLLVATAVHVDVLLGSLPRSSTTRTVVQYRYAGHGCSYGKGVNYYSVDWASNSGHPRI